MAAIKSRATPATRDAIAALETMSETELEAFASSLLLSNWDKLDLAAAPLVASALQVYWTRLAAGLRAEDIGRMDVPGVCPVCGAHPVSSLVRIGGAEQGLRYLVCSLCATEWNLVRVKCSACDSTKGIAYYGIENGSPAVKAETCDQCRSYLKIFNMEKDPQVDPTADDLASLALDIMIEERDYHRSGINFLMLPGAT
jgi:FdhE protein